MGSQHLEHQLHRHQHRIVAAHQPAFGDAAEIIDQRDIERRFQRAIGAWRNGARTDRKLGRERHDAPAIGEMRADGAADAAMNPARENSVLPAETFQRAGKILVRPQPQRKGPAIGLRIGPRSRAAPARTI